MLKLITRGLSLRAGVATLPCVTLFTRLHSGTCSSCAAEQHHIQAEIDPHFTKTYMDFQATTPVDPRVLDAMLPYLTFKYANPHSRSHRMGNAASDAVEVGRKQISDLIKADDASEVIFTSGATESNNAAIKGLMRYLMKGDPSKNHIITTPIEHKCILDTVRVLRESEGCDVTVLPVGRDGIVRMEDLKKAIKPTTALISTMFVNNEIGVIQPVAEIGKLCHDSGIFFHTDAAQALGKVPIDVNAMNIDLMSMSSHKLYGPKGIGALYVRKSGPRVRLEPILSGGGQERGMRSGTLAPAQIVGFGEACRIAGAEMEYDNAHVKKLFDMLVDGVMSKLDHVVLNGSRTNRYYGNANLSFKFVEGESLMLHLSQFMVSSGSACTSASLEPSYVLHSLGVTDDVAHTSIRFGLGRFTTEQDIRQLLEALWTVVPKLRDMSPLYEMVVKDGVDLSTIKWSE